AIEAKCENDRDAVLELLAEKPVWNLPLVRDHILGRLMRRFAQAGTRRDLGTCARLLELSPGQDQTQKLLAGFEAASKGLSMSDLPDELVSALSKSGRMPFVLSLRRGDSEALDRALGIIADPRAPVEERLQDVGVLGELKQPRALPVLIKLIGLAGAEPLQPAVFAALQQFDAPEIAREVLSQLNSLTNQAQAAALGLLASRPAWSLALLNAIDAGQVKPATVSQDALQRMKIYPDARIGELIHKFWGKERVETTAEMKRQIAQYEDVVRNGSGDPYEGRKLFSMSCGLCHRLFGQGGQIGPDLTPYKRDDLDTILLNVVNPSAEIREGYENYVVTTKDGRTLSGFLADKDNRVVVLRGVDGINTVLPQDQIAEMKSTGVSLMPVGLLSALKEQQVRDLFAYLRSSQPLVGESQNLSRSQAQ
ncbi:MAG TPA: c-type cytochrome, partial [Verrucomicrobiae bacterium]|nr:c-type cytochrome [Verrucomicrobiae bacterium]